MSERSKSQRSAEARYDAKRRNMVSLGRVSKSKGDWIDKRRHPGESRAKAVVRLLGIECV